MKFELHTRYTLTTPNAISDAGVGEIIRFIQSQNLKADPWLSLNPDYAVPFLYPLPGEWEYTWLVQKGEYRGTFPKRVSKYYQMTYGVKCPDSFLAELGQIARRNSGEAATYEFDFTNRFDWNAGDFGESRYSCFWGNRTGARTMLTENGGLAIRFYRANKGFARAWLVAIEDDQYIIFNGYGFAGNATLTIARLFAQFVGKTYKKIQLVNNGSAGRTLYINNSIGYLIALANQLAQTGRYDFQWDEIYEETCYGCGEGLSEDDIRYGADDHPYCENCFFETFDYCRECGETHYMEDLIYVEDEGEYCEYCFDRYAVTCENCGTHVLRRWADSRGDKWYCENCTPES